MPEQKGFNERLIEAMQEMVNPTKSATAQTGKFSYKYETLDQILAIVRPALMRHGLGLTQYVRGGMLCTSVFDGAESKVMDERPMVETDDPQAMGSWETYMRRYSLRSVFGLCGEDDDGAAAKGAAPRKGKRTPPRLERYMALKDHALAIGIKPEGISSWMRSRFPGKKLTDLDESQLQEAEGFIETLIKDRERLDAGPVE